MEGAVEVRCPQCRRFLAEVPAGTPIRARCRDCRMVFERVAQPTRALTIRRLRVIGVS